MSDQQLPNLTEELGDTLLEIDRVLTTLTGTTVHARETAKCLKLLELKEKIVKLEEALREARVCANEPIIREWMSDQLKTPF